MDAQDRQLLAHIQLKAAPGEFDDYLTGNGC